MKNKKRLFGLAAVWAVVLTLFFCFPAEAAEGAASLEEFDASDIQRFLDGLSGENPARRSFLELMKELLSGNLLEAAREAARQIQDALFLELRTNLSLLGQMLILALAGAVFSCFSGIFGSVHVSETGFYVVYLLMMTFLGASFFSSIRVAGKVAEELFQFMRALLPAYFLAVSMAGGALTSASVCGVTFAAIGVVQGLVSRFLIPMMRVYMLLTLAGNLFPENMVSHLTGLLEKCVSWTIKTMFGVIVGFHVIQGMVLPQADAVKNAAILRAVQLIPGVGAGAGAGAQLVMGSGILIKNTAGAAAVAVLLLLAAVPVLKLLLLMLFYSVAAAIMQPVCDKRLTACMAQTAAGHGLLLKIIGYSLALFAVTLAVLCVSTNGAFYAG